jgi:hypothetical protein
MGFDNPQEQCFSTTDGNNWQRNDKFRPLMGNGSLYWSSKA